jgi:hypothetical protein
MASLEERQRALALRDLKSRGIVEEEDNCPGARLPADNHPVSPWLRPQRTFLGALQTLLDGSVSKKRNTLNCIA